MPPTLRKFLLSCVPVLLLAGAPAGASADEAPPPPPVHGITFDEWTSANARLAAGRPLREVLGVLRVPEAAWDEADAAFGQALRSGPPGGPLLDRYGRVFADPNAGRFQEAGTAPKPGRLQSFEEYARVQAALTAAQEAGQDPVQVLQREYGLTPFDYSQEGARWIGMLADAAAKDPAALRRLQRIQDAALAEARQRYGVGPRKTPAGGG